MNNNVKQRKFLLVLPLLAIPFLDHGFRALGGGKRKRENGCQWPRSESDLPDARLKEDKLMDKLSFYEKADKDSMNGRGMRSDPYYRRDTSPVFPHELEELTTMTAEKYNQAVKQFPLRGEYQ